MPELEHQSETSNEVSYATWSAQDRLRQELRELEEQQKAQSTTQEATAQAQQQWEQRVRRSQNLESKSETATTTRQRKRRVGSFARRLPYSFDVLLLCAVTLLMSAVVGVAVRPTAPSYHYKHLAGAPAFGAPANLLNGEWDLENFHDATLPGMDFSGSKIHFDQAPVPGQSGIVTGNITYKIAGEIKGTGEFHGIYDSATRRFDLYEDTVMQYGDFDKLRMVEGEIFGQIGRDGHSIVEGGTAFPPGGEAQSSFSGEQIIDTK